MLYHLPGENVKNSEKYFKRHGREFRGVIVQATIEIGEGNIIIRWLSQSGNVDERLTNQMVLMSKDDIEAD